MISKFFLYLFILALVVSCNATLTITEIIPAIIDNGNHSKSTIFKDRMDFINSYVAKIDFKANDFNNFNSEELTIFGDRRIIISNESERNIVYKNKSIVRVKYKDHLVNNFIKSKVFYYDNNELICIKIYEILPNEFNEAILYQRSIYFHNNLPISDSDALNPTNNCQSLAILGREFLKNEYLSLN